MIEHDPCSTIVRLSVWYTIYSCIIVYKHIYNTENILFVRAWLEFQIACLILTILTSRMSLNKLIDIELCFPLCQNRKLKSRFFFEDRKWSLDSEKWNRDGFIRVPLNPLVHYSFHQMAISGCNYHIFRHRYLEIHGSLFHSLDLLRWSWGLPRKPRNEITLFGPWEHQR